MGTRAVATPKAHGASALDGQALHDLAIKAIDEDDTYLALVYLLLALDAGTGEAAGDLDVLTIAELISDEDEQLAHLQLALWYRHGHQVGADAKLARQHLKATRRDGAALPRDLDAAIVQVRDLIGLPDDLEVARPFGPATPGTPGWLRPDHLDAASVPALPRVAPGARPQRKVPTQATEPVYAITFSPDGQQAISGGVMGELLVWDVATRAPIRKLPNPGDTVSVIAFDPSGRHIAIGGEDRPGMRVFALDGDDFTVLSKGHKHEVGAVAFHPDGERLFSADHAGVLQTWQLGKSKPLATHDLRVDVWSMSISPDGHRLVVGSSEEHTIVVVDVETWSVEARWPWRHYHLIHSLAFDPSGERVLSASRDGSIALWNVADGELVRLFTEGHRDGVLTAAFTDDGRIVSGGLDRRLVRWDPDTGASEELASLDSLHAVATRGSHVVVGGDDGLTWVEIGPTKPPAVAS